uniref:Uncharacterized protein n=1 Tax=Anguilla anguilla TaxID=7936 RepID=A0A0E9P900_ANGAN
MFFWRAAVSSKVSSHGYHSCLVFFLKWTHE